MKESEFSKKAIKKLKELPLTFVIRTQAGSIGGIPDLLICCNGYFFAWELKTEEGKTTPLQEYTLKQLRKAKACASVVRPSSLDAHLRMIQEIAFDKIIRR